MEDARHCCNAKNCDSASSRALLCRTLMSKLVPNLPSNQEKSLQREILLCAHVLHWGKALYGRWAARPFRASQSSFVLDCSMHARGAGCPDVCFSDPR